MVYTLIMLPTLRQLQYLKLLADHGSFSRAAEAAHVTQPTLSAGIKQLEESLGVLIVERGQRFLGLTAEGERVLAQPAPELRDRLRGMSASDFRSSANR